MTEQAQWEQQNHHIPPPTSTPFLLPQPFPPCLNVRYLINNSQTTLFLFFKITSSRISLHHSKAYFNVFLPAVVLLVGKQQKWEGTNWILLWTLSIHAILGVLLLRKYRKGRGCHPAVSQL